MPGHLFSPLPSATLMLRRNIPLSRSSAIPRTAKPSCVEHSRCAAFLLPLRLFSGIIFCLTLSLAQTSTAAEAWRVGTWKTAQTIQPFLYQHYAAPFAPDTTVTVLPFTNPADQKAALLAGSLDMTGTTLALAIQAASRGEPVRLVAALVNKCSALVVRKDGPILSSADLKGKRIAYVPGTMHEILLREVLHREGIDADRDVSLMRIDFFDMGTALAKNDVDAFLSGEPFPTQAVQQGYGRILAYPYFGDSIGTINAGMLMRSDFIAEHPEQAMRMVATHKAVTEALRSDISLWLDTAASLFGVDKAVLKAAAPNMELAWDMDDAFVQQVAALGKRMKELGIIQKEPDYATLVDRTFVDALRAGKRTLHE